MALEELGATYIKLGQALSTRTDLLPPEYIAELSKLQDQAPAIPYAEIRRMIVAELGDPPEMLFREFCVQPVAAASLSQVHHATLYDGRSVAVKVQRPHAPERVAEDLGVLIDLADFFTKNTEVGRRYDFSGWAREFAFTMNNELDYRREGANAERIRANFADDPAVKVPAVFWETTTRRVLTLEFVGGIKLTDVDALDQGGFDRRRLAEECARIVLTEIFIHGFFHADPHPGNLFVQPDGSIALIDMGMVGKLDERLRESLIRVTLDLAREDAEALADELMILGVARGPVHRQALRVELDQSIQRFMDGPREDFSLAAMLNDVLATAGRHHLHAPSDLLLLARTIAMGEGLSAILDPEFDMVAYTREFLERRFAGMGSLDAIADKLRGQTLDAAELLVSLPGRARRLLGLLERGEIVVTTRLEDAHGLSNQLQGAANRLAVAIVVASIIAGMAFLLGQSEGRSAASTVVEIMLILAVVGGIGLVISFWKSTRNF